MSNKIQRLSYALFSEKVACEELTKTPQSQDLSAIRKEIQKHILSIAFKKDLESIVATEKLILQGELERYSNSDGMYKSLTAATNEFILIERNINLVNDPEKYKPINEAFSLPKNRKNGLPYDEVRQALASHSTRLANLDKSRLTHEEKQIINARKGAIATALEIYIEKQQKAVGIEKKNNVSTSIKL